MKGQQASFDPAETSHKAPAVGRESLGETEAVA